MKMKNTITAAAIMLAGFVTNLNAQSTAYASTTAVLVTPISIVKAADMHFGTLSGSAASGTATLDDNNVVTPSLGVSVIDPALATTAQFTVTGAADETISITIPSAAITLTNGVQNMTVDGFTCDGGTGVTLDGSGSATLKVFGVLHVAANQASGTYSNNTLNVATGLFVTVNYN